MSSAVAQVRIGIGLPSVSIGINLDRAGIGLADTRALLSASAGLLGRATAQCAAAFGRALGMNRASIEADGTSGTAVLFHDLPRYLFTSGSILEDRHIPERFVQETRGERSRSPCTGADRAVANAQPVARSRRGM